MNILIISNGVGEDVIACNLIRAFRAVGQQTFHIIPLVGKGEAYPSAGFTPLIQNDALPSGGFIRTFSDLVKDLKAGLISQHLKQRKLIKKIAKNADLTLCIGDVFCMIMGGLSNPSKVVAMPTAKSDLFMQHSAIEVQLFKHLSSLVFTRDELTADNLKGRGVPAYFKGNAMLGELIPKGIHFNGLNPGKVMGILPGSREEAYANLSYIVDLLPRLSKENNRLQFLLSYAPTMVSKKFKILLNNAGWSVDEKEDHWHCHSGNLQLWASPSFADVLSHCSVLIGLAGTANEQAVYSGRQVLCFEGFGPQSTPKRFSEQKKLLGEGLHFISPRSEESISAALKGLLLKHPDPPPLDKQAKPADNIVKSIHTVLDLA